MIRKPEELKIELADDYKDSILWCLSLQEFGEADRKTGMSWTGQDMPFSLGKIQRC